MRENVSASIMQLCVDFFERHQIDAVVRVSEISHFFCGGGMLDIKKFNLISTKQQWVFLYRDLILKSIVCKYSFF